MSGNPDYKNLLDYMPLIVAALSVFGAMLLYYVQKRMDRTSKLLELRRNAYIEYVTLFTQQALNHTQPEFVDLKTLQHMKMLVIGSDKVMKEAAKFHHFTLTSNGKLTDIQARTHLAKICAAMRQDAFKKTKMTTEEYANLIPVGTDWDPK